MFCTILEISTIATSILNIFCIKSSLQNVVDHYMLSLSLRRLFLDKLKSDKSKSNIARVFNAHDPAKTLYMPYTSFVIHQPQLSLLKSNQPFLFYSIRRLRDCHRRLRTFLHLVQRIFTSLGTMDGQHS